MKHFWNENEIVNDGSNNIQTTIIKFPPQINKRQNENKTPAGFPFPVGANQNSEQKHFNSVISKIWNVDVFEFWHYENLEFGILKFWNVEMLKLNLEVLKQLKCWNLKCWNLYILKSWNLEILKLWNFEIWNCPNIENVKFKFGFFENSKFWNF